MIIQDLFHYYIYIYIHIYKYLKTCMGVFFTVFHCLNLLPFSVSGDMMIYDQSCVEYHSELALAVSFSRNKLTSQTCTHGWEPHGDSNLQVHALLFLHGIHARRQHKLKWRHMTRLQPCTLFTRGF